MRSFTKNTLKKNMNPQELKGIASQMFKTLSPSAEQIKKANGILEAYKSGTPLSRLFTMLREAKGLAGNAK